MSDLTKLTLEEAMKGLQRQTFSSRELCEALIAKKAEVDDTVKGYLHLNAEASLREADASDQRRQANQQLGPLDGIPIAMKDNMAVKNQPCTCASKILEPFTATYDATVTQRLRDAGFIFLGRTNMDEFAMGSTTENSACQTTTNPWNSEHVPGGSSGGSAAVVGASEALAALGSDTGGSIRQPAAFCGTVGLKPTYGRISRYGLVAFASSLDQIGPLSRDVKDAAILLDTISGHDPKDSTSMPEPPTNTAQSIDNLDPAKIRIGLPKEYVNAEGLHPEIKTRIEQAAASFEAAGAEVVEVSLPHTEYAIAAYYVIATAEASANLARYDGIRYGARVTREQASLLDVYRDSREAGFGAEVKRRIILGTYVLSSGYYDAYYLKAQKVRTLIKQDFENAFKECDVLLAPTSPAPAYKRGELSTPLEMYLADIFTISVNLAGNCGISVPAGFVESGLPTGLQFIGPIMGEEMLLKSARFFESNINPASA